MFNISSAAIYSSTTKYVYQCCDIHSSLLSISCPRMRLFVCPWEFDRLAPFPVFTIRFIRSHASVYRKYVPCL